MAVKILAEFKRFAIVTVALLGFLVIVNWPVAAGTLNQVLPDQKQQSQYTVIIAQNETQTSTKERTERSPESQESNSKSDKKKKSAEAKEKPYKDFRPSEKIEAEQAVDFPYDI